MRVELAFKPDLARKIGVGEIDRDRTPHRKIDRSPCAGRHRLHNRDRQAQCVALSKRTIDADKRRA